MVPKRRGRDCRRRSKANFDFDAQPAVRNQVGSLASGGFLTEARNIVLLGPPGTGKTHYADLRVMPTWPLNPLRSRVIGLSRSA